MNEKDLFKISLLCSLVGILILLIISERIEAPSIKISEINKELIEKQVKISGNITSITQKPGILIFNVKDETGQIKVITFGEEVKLERNLAVEIEGIIKEYQGALEIEAKQIKLL